MPSFTMLLIYFFSHGCASLYWCFRYENDNNIPFLALVSDPILNVIAKHITTIPNII